MYTRSGTIEIICGPMFSGKTEELIRRVKRVQIARQRVQIFKPTIDNRYSKNDVVSHSSLKIEALAIGSSSEILQNLDDSTRTIAIDEVQFFDEEILKVINKLVRRGIRVICAGLDQDYTGSPFGSMPDLLAIADRVDKIQAICTVCGSSASKSFKKQKESTNTQLVEIGERDMYEARCWDHFDYFDDKADFFSYQMVSQKSLQEKSK